MVLIIFSLIGNGKKIIIRYLVNRIRKNEIDSYAKRHQSQIRNFRDIIRNWKRGYKGWIKKIKWCTRTIKKSRDIIKKVYIHWKR